MAADGSVAVPSGPEVAAAGGADGRAAPKPKAKTRAILLVLGAAAAIGGGTWYASHTGLESTDNAQVDGEIVTVPARAPGLVLKVLVAENQVVKAGDLLAELDADTLTARLAQAQANLDAAQASAEAAAADARVTETNARSNKSAAEASLQGATVGASSSADGIAEAEARVASAQSSLRQASADWDRAKSLVASGAFSKAQADQAETAFETATANLAQARAHLAQLKASRTQAQAHVREASARYTQTSAVEALIDQARAKARTAEAQVAVAKALRDIAALDVSYTRILAPADGVISKKSITAGQMVAPGQAIAMLIPTKQPWITANFKETQVAKMHPGQPATFTVDAYPGRTFHGELESFSGATGSRFALLPPDNATGNFTKVVQRVPVRVRLKDAPTDVVLRPGMSVELTLDTRH